MFLAVAFIAVKAAYPRLVEPLLELDDPKTEFK
jgi:hypothetical protein